MTTKINYSQINGAPVSLFDYMSAAQKADALAGTHTLDMSAAMQAAVDYCALNRWPTLELPGLIRLDSKVNIDRPVDTMTGVWTIKGTGGNGGFYTSNAISMFDTTIAVANNPKSEQIRFDNVRFEASADTLNCYVLEGKAFLRMQFSACTFYKIRCATTLNYYQSFYFDTMCRIIYTRGIFLNATLDGAHGATSGNVYDLHWDNNFFEKGSLGSGVPTGFVKAGGQIFGSSFFGGVFEGNEGSFYDAAITSGCSFYGIYFEENGDMEIKLGSFGPATLVSNVFYQTTDRYSVNCGTCLTVNGMGNVTNKRLYYDIAMSRSDLAQGLTSVGDVADIEISALLPQGPVGSFTGTLNGFAAGQSVAVTYVKTGKDVTLTWGTTTATSNVNTMSLTGIPAALLPSGRYMYVAVPTVDNGVDLGMMYARVSSGGIEFAKTWLGLTGLAFTAAGTKGIYAASITYQT